jgi:hypothetical protein
MPYKDPIKQKAAQRRYYEENIEKYSEARQRKANLIRRKSEEIKGSTPCADCDMQYPHYMMDFDHLPEFVKVRNLSAVNNFSTVAEWMKEVAKCEVVCANCHRHRTYMRQCKGV